jgi:hypothetical protein
MCALISDVPHLRDIDAHLVFYLSCLECVRRRPDGVIRAVLAFRPNIPNGVKAESAGSIRADS